MTPPTYTIYLRRGETRGTAARIVSAVASPPPVFLLHFPFDPPSFRRFFLPRPALPCLNNPGWIWILRAPARTHPPPREPLKGVKFFSRRSRRASKTHAYKRATIRLAGLHYGLFALQARYERTAVAARVYREFTPAGSEPG